MNYARNKRYFSYGTLIIGPILAVVIGIVIAIAGFFRAFGGEGLGLLYVGVGVFAAGLIWRPIMRSCRPKGELIDEEVREEVKQLYQKALDKHGITEEMVQRSSPLVLGGYILKEKNAALLYSTKLTKTTGVGKETLAQVDSGTVLASAMSASFSVIPVDKSAALNYAATDEGVARSGLAEYTIFLFSEEKVFVYTRQFSLVDPEAKESAQVFSYRDIVSVSSEPLKYGAQAFIVKASGGTTLTIPSSSSAAGDIKGSVTAFMQLVREKKST